MTNLIDRHLDEVAALCRLAGARKLDAFGSAVRADFDPQTSDLDFLVEFDDVPPAAYLSGIFAHAWNDEARVPSGCTILNTMHL